MSCLLLCKTYGKCWQAVKGIVLIEGSVPFCETARLGLWIEFCAAAVPERARGRSCAGKDSMCEDSLHRHALSRFTHFNTEFL